MANYENDLFISYRRSDKEWVRWTRDNFAGPLGSLLRPGLGRTKIYIDESIETGASWPNHLALNLSRSKLLVAVLSRDYFQSKWCRLELALMFNRERSNHFRTPQNPFGLIIPIVIDDGSSFPPEIQEMQSEPLHDYANPFIRTDSPKQEAFAEVLRKNVCPAIERALNRIPAFDPKWEQIAHKQFENMFQTVMQTQTTVPPLTLPQLP